MIPLPSKPKIIKKGPNSATFVIEGLYPGYGVTLGNALRRVLLSSLPGNAITQVKIKGAAHEFSTISGVKEDVIMIILNLKKLHFQNFSSEPQTITLKVKGEREVLGKDFKLPPQLKITNPSEHIALLTSSSAELEIEALVESGIGYQPLEKRELSKAEVGVFPIDAIFTPIVKVSFSIENMRVGKKTDFDRLILEIETNGVLSPEQSLKKALDILVSHMSFLADALSDTDKDSSQQSPANEHLPEEQQGQPKTEESKSAAKKAAKKDKTSAKETKKEKKEQKKKK